MRAVHAQTLNMNVPLPESGRWRVRELERGTVFEATHAATRSRLTIRLSNHDSLMNRQRCEAKAREANWVPNTKVRTVEDSVTVAPVAYDTRLVVASEPGGSDHSPVRGHIFGFGAYIRKCLTMHYVTEVPSGEYSKELSARLATIRVQTLPALTFDVLEEVKREER